jgi:nicotinamidase-related amidase
MMLPDFYNPNDIGTSFMPDVNRAVDAGRKLNLIPAENDTTRIALILVDMQVDFVHPNGALYVPGAVEDSKRIVEWIYQHVGDITRIYASLDSHYPIQIFSSTWWLNEAGKHPYPYTVITSDDVQNGTWQPIYEVDWSIQYVTALENQHKKELMIWPYHCLVGTPGHNLTPSLYEAISYHAATRQAQPQFITKGEIAKTEHYSMLEPEVKVPDHPQGTLNEAFLNDLREFDLIYVAGEAKSHCVLETVNSIMKFFKGQPEFIGKIRILLDGMSSVVHPEIDFDAMADESFSRHQKDGLTFVTTQDAIG